MVLSLSIKLTANQTISSGGRPPGESPEASRFSNLSLRPNENQKFYRISARSLAERTALAKVSELSSSLNLREDSTKEQIQALNSLIDLANKISTENISSRVSSLQDYASKLISDASSAYGSAVDNEPQLASNLNAVIVRDYTNPTQESEHYFRTTLAAVKSLADLGVSSSLSFQKSELETTQSTLYAARDILRSSLSAYDSNRSSISQEISQAGKRGELSGSDFSTNEIEQIARTLATKISLATEDILSAHRPEQLDVGSLLRTPAEEDKARQD